VRAVRSFDCTDTQALDSVAASVAREHKINWLSETSRQRQGASRLLSETSRIKIGPEILSDCSEFSKISSDARDALLAAATKRSYCDSEFIYLQDDEADHLYFVVTGHIRLSYLMDDGSAILYAILPPGESFGELGVFENNTYCDMATAVGPTIIAAVSSRIFRALSDRHPQLNAALARLVARRYRSYVTLMQNLSLKTLPARLAQALLRLVDQLGARTQYANHDVAYVGSMVTQADLGLMARGARGNVNRALKAWERAGWIAIHDRCIFILNRAKLESLAIEEGI
jgi:CRP/FNR family transcriptional regulator, cyclic AMP receptor protein